MLTERDYSELLKANINVGGHGHSHEPLTKAADPEREIKKSAAIVRDLIGERETLAMSFPHGRYDRQLLDAARANGFRLCFTSDAAMTDKDTLSTGGPIGRIPIALCDGRTVGSMRETRVAVSLAYSMFLRPIARQYLSGKSSHFLPN